MKHIKVENYLDNQKIKIISLNRPEVKNAFHPEMISEITDFFNSENLNKSSDLIVLKGEGSVFCAGADLGWMQGMVQYSYEQNLEDSKKLWEMFNSIYSGIIPVVAICQGAVFGGALGLLACCDFVFAEEKTQFCFSEVKLGLAPAVISDFITRKIQDAYVRPYMISAEIFTTIDALKIGLAAKSYQNQITIEEVIKKFGQNGFEAMKSTKALLNQMIQQNNFEDRKLSCAKTISERRVSEEAQTRLKNFLNKRP